MVSFHEPAAMAFYQPVRIVLGERRYGMVGLVHWRVRMDVEVALRRAPESLWAVVQRERGWNNDDNWSHLLG